jgi:putative tryptophan/tyrosine transport system substrate-binding protein
MKIPRKICSLPILLLVFSPASSLAQEKTAKPPAARIGVIQTVSSPDYDAAVKGFEKALAEAGFRDGTHVVYDRQNARGDKAHARAIAQKLRDGNAALIHSVATPASQAAVRVIRDIPIVFSSVTDPRDARLVPRKSLPGTRTGTNVTGVSDHWPVFSQFQMYTRFFPKAKRWGTIYNSQEPRSLSHVMEMRAAAKRLGVEMIEAKITGSAEAASAARSLAGKIQVLNLPFDPTVLSSFEAIVKVCNERKIPLFGGDVRSATKGAMAAYGFDYFQIGYAAGKMAVRILKGESPGEIPWELAEKLVLVINETAARDQGVIIPPDLLKRADRVIK